MRPIPPLLYIALTVIAIVVAIAAVIWLFTDVIDVDDEGRDRGSAPVVATL